MFPAAGHIVMLSIIIARILVSVWVERCLTYKEGQRTELPMADTHFISICRSKTTPFTWDYAVPDFADVYFSFIFIYLSSNYRVRIVKILTLINISTGPAAIHAKPRHCHSIQLGGKRTHKLHDILLKLIRDSIGKARELTREETLAQ